MGSYVNGVYVPAALETGWGEELNDFLTRSGEEYINVKAAPYGALANGTNDRTRIQAAIDAAHVKGGIVYFPPGEYTITSGLTYYGNVRLVGSGSGTSWITYTGSGTALVQSTPGTRIYGFGISHLTLVGTASAAVGADLNSLSNGYFEDFVATGFSTGTCVSMNAPTAGYSVYNTFVHCQFFDGVTALRIYGDSSNEHRFFGCRFYGTTYGLRIENSNSTQVISCAFEVCGDAVNVMSDAGAGFADNNHIIGCRFEGNTTGVRIADTNVRGTVIAFPYFVANGTDIVDPGGSTRTAVIGDVSNGKMLSFKAVLDDTPYLLERVVNGGSSLPALVVRDSATGSGTPITVQIETERDTGSFILGKRGGVPYFEVKSTGEIIFAGPLNHDGTTVGFYGHAPAAQSAAYSVTNPTTDRALNVTGDTLPQVAEVLGTLIADLKAIGLIG